MKTEFEMKSSSFISESGVKITVAAYRAPRKTERTWKTSTLHAYAYAGIGGRGNRKGKSTKTFQL
jgi:hypothetical protein